MISITESIGKKIIPKVIQPIQDFIRLESSAGLDSVGMHGYRPRPGKFITAAILYILLANRITRWS